MTVKEMRQKIEEVASKVFEEEAPRLEEKLQAALDRYCQEVIAKFMGFNKNWGRWELDHCNGRAGESAAGDFLRKKAGAKVNEWLEKQAGALPDLPPDAVKSLRKNYLDIYKSILREELAALAKEKGKERAKEILTEAVNELGRAGKGGLT